ncbi:MAG: ATP-binding cassette domain-containing protein, partial [Alphaproteobacteria bacterium]|nr:ATP-binding cassette domain-containing protein [Alphaproteobacteria bacterium]
MSEANDSREDVVIAQGLTKQFHAGPIAVVAVNEVDLRLPRGKLVALRGSSGCGKSTFLNLLGALDRPTGGALTVDGVDVAGLRGKEEVGYRRHKTGFVFQSFNLIPHLTATENVMLPMEFTGLPRRQQEERARSI